MSSFRVQGHSDLTVAIERNLASGVGIEVERALEMKPERGGWPKRSSSILRMA